MKRFGLIRRPGRRGMVAMADWAARGWAARLFTTCLPRHEIGDQYLIRWVLLSTRWGSIYVHCFLGPDTSALRHDHPRDFLSVVLRGWYVERVGLRVNGLQTRWAWSWRTHRAEFIHQVVQVSPTPCWSVVLTGRRRRPWQFIDPETLWTYPAETPPARKESCLRSFRS